MKRSAAKEALTPPDFQKRLKNSAFFLTWPVIILLYDLVTGQDFNTSISQIIEIKTPIIFFILGIVILSGLSYKIDSFIFRLLSRKSPEKGYYLASFFAKMISLSVFPVIIISMIIGIFNGSFERGDFPVLGTLMGIGAIAMAVYFIPKAKEDWQQYQNYPSQ